MGVCTIKTVFGFIDKVDGRNRTFLKVLAYLENNTMVEVGNIYEELPNNGKVFVPAFISDGIRDKLGFFMLNESPTYNRDIPSSSKYVLSHEVPNIEYFEIVEIDYSFLTEKQLISNMIKAGFKNSITFTSKILFLTKDDYLVGPFSIKLNNENQWICQLDDNGLIDVRINKENIIKYEDINLGVYRYFISNKISHTNADEYLDCSTNERVMREALKIVKEGKDAQEISRAVIRMLADIVNNTPASVKQERVSKAIELLKNNLLSYEDLSKMDGTLLSNESVQLIIKENVDQILVEEKKKLEKNNRKLINENKQLLIKKEMLQTETNTLLEEKNSINDGLIKADAALQKKIKEMEENVYKTYLNLLPGSKMLISEEKTSKNSLNVASSQWFEKETEDNETTIKEMDILLDKITKNLEQIDIDNKDANFIALTVIGSIMFRNPIIIKGENSFNISQIIGWSISGNDHITVFPEIQSYSNETLISIFENYNRLEAVKSLHISSIENSSAELNLPSFIDYWTVSTKVNYPELLLVSVRDIEDISDSFLSKLKYTPIINTDNFGAKDKLRKARLGGNIKFGITPIEIIDETKMLKKRSELFIEFKETVGELTRMKSSKISSEFKKWFCLFEKHNLMDEEVTKWLLETLLKDYIDEELFSKILNELILEELQGV